MIMRDGLLRSHLGQLFLPHAQVLSKFLVHLVLAKIAWLHEPINDAYNLVLLHLQRAGRY